MNRLYIISLILLVFTVSCKNKAKEKTDIKGDIEYPEYAKLFNIERHEGYKYINVLDNSGKNIFRLLIAGDKGSVPKNTDADFVIDKEIKKIGILSSTHIGYLNTIGKTDLIYSSTNPHRIYDSTLFARYNKGEIVNIGDAMKTNVEQILALKPDVVFYTGFEQNQNTKRLMKRAGIAYIPVTEWKEESIFGRTEWVKLFGEIFNQRHKADSVFEEKVRNYNKLKESVKNTNSSPSVLYGNNFKGTWYMPGGKSYMAHLLADAGADYHFKNDSTSGSLHLSIEYIIDILKDADIWLAPSANSLEELKKKDKHYSVFKALKNAKVYNYTARMNVNGFNDYWESGVMNPDIILSDIIHILHPELEENYNLYYYKQLR